MKEKQVGSGIGAGGISILTIFVVLCLATLAALSLVSARADQNLAEKNALASAEYYQADAKAEEILHKLLAAAKDGPGWEASLEEDGITVDKRDATAVASYQVPVNENKSIYAEISLTLSQDGGFTGEWKRLCWRTQVKEDPGTEDESLNLLQ